MGQGTQRLFADVPLHQQHVTSRMASRNTFSLSSSSASSAAVAARLTASTTSRRFASGGIMAVGSAGWPLLHG